MDAAGAGLAARRATPCAARAALRALMARFPFASCVPFSNNAPLRRGTRERSGVLFRAAAYEAPPDACVQQIEAVLRPRPAPRPCATPTAARASAAPLRAACAQGDDCALAGLAAGRRHQRRGLDQGAAAAGAAGAGLWPPAAARPAPSRRVAVQAQGQAGVQLLRRGGAGDRKRTWRSAPARREERLASVQGELRCGTNCGSCVPELKRMVRASVALAQAA